MDAKVCSTPGCHKTVYGPGELCGKCLDGILPIDRGPVTERELLRARAYRHFDQGVTRSRLLKNNQPVRLVAGAVPGIVAEALARGRRAEAPASRPVSVFLSYATEEREKVKAIERHLRALGHDVWMDIYRLTTLHYLDETIFGALRTSAYLVACLSRACQDESRFVVRELREGLERASGSRYLYLLPVMLDDSDPPAEFAPYNPLNFAPPTHLDALALALEIGSEDYL